jgi:hypothetical protein
VLLLVAFCVLAAPLIGWKAVNNRQLSIYDEWQYADRVHQVTTGDLVIREGEKISSWAHRQLFCRGITRNTPVQPDICAQRLPEANIANSAATDPPLYFWVTGGVAAVPLQLGLTDNVITTARLVGVLWAALAMWTLFLLSRALGVSRPAAAVVAATQVTVPVFVQQYTYLTPHALDVPVGAFMALAALKTMRGRWPLWTVALGAFLACFSKGTNITVVLMVGLFYLAVIAWPGRFDRARRMRAFWAGVVTAVSAVVTTLGWSFVTGWLSVEEAPPPGNFIVDSLDPNALILDATRAVGAIGENQTTFFGTILATAMFGTALATWSGAVPSKPLLRAFGAAYVLGALAAPLLLAGYVFVTTDQYIGLHFRYCLAVWAVGVALAGRLLTTRTAVALGAVFLAAYWWMPFVWGLDGIAS